MIKHWLAGHLVKLAQVLTGTDHFCAVRFDGGGWLVSCDGYGHGMVYGFGESENGSDSWEIKEFDSDDAEAALDWLHPEDEVEA